MTVAVAVLWANVASAVHAAEKSINIERSEARAVIEPSKASETGIQADLRNQSYDLVRIPSSDGHSMILLVHRQQDLLTAVDVDGFLRKRLAVVVWRVDGEKRRLLFRLNENAEASQIDGGRSLLYATNYGCCGGTDTHAIYDLENGQRLFFAGGDLEPYVFSLVDAKIHRVQFVGLHISGSERDREVYGEARTPPNTRRMMLTLSAKAGLTDRLVLSYEDEKQAFPVEHVGWKSVSDGQAPGRDLVLSQTAGQRTRPIFLVRIRTKNPIEIPVDGDRFALSDISKPLGIEVVRLPVAK